MPFCLFFGLGSKEINVKKKSDRYCFGVWALKRWQKAETNIIELPAFQLAFCVQKFPN